MIENPASDRKLLKKRAVNGQPVQVYIEYLIVSDSTIYDQVSGLLNTTNKTIVLQYMQIFFAQVTNAINQRYQISLQNDTDLRITVALQGMIIETVSVIKKRSPINFNNFFLQTECIAIKLEQSKCCR